MTKKDIYIYFPLAAIMLILTSIAGYYLNFSPLHFFIGAFYVSHLMQNKVDFTGILGEITLIYAPLTFMYYQGYQYYRMFYNLDSWQSISSSGILIAFAGFSLCVGMLTYGIYSHKINKKLILDKDAETKA